MLMRDKLVSVGMPVYNGEKYISKAIDSILNQTVSHFELIISDNASCDATEQICRSYLCKDSRIRYFRHPENRGAVENFKFVFEKASGEYFMWAAADDLWSQNWLEEMLKLQNIGSCIAFGGLKVIDGEGRLFSHPASGSDLEFGKSKFFRRMKFFLMPNISGKANPIYGLFPRQHITSNHLSVLGNNHVGADMLFVYSVIECLPVVVNNKSIFYKRYVSGGLCSGLSINKLNIIDKFISSCGELMVFEYAKISSISESLCIFIIAPIAYIYHCFHKFFFRAKKK